MRLLPTVVALAILIGIARPAAADATVFLGTMSNPSNRLTRGFGVGFSLLVVGFEFEYGTVSEDDLDATPALTTGMGNLLVQTPELHPVLFHRGRRRLQGASPGTPGDELRHQYGRRCEDSTRRPLTASPGLSAVQTARLTALFADTPFLRGREPEVLKGPGKRASRLAPFRTYCAKLSTGVRLKGACPPAYESAKVLYSVWTSAGNPSDRILPIV